MRNEAENNDLILRIDLSKLQYTWSPFRFIIWNGLDTPITLEEISQSLAHNILVPPCISKNQNIGNTPTRQEHIGRIAWFVKNLDSKSNPIDIDFGVTGILEKIYIQDGNHRLAAALYRKDKFIYVSCSGSLDRVSNLEYKFPIHIKILKRVGNFFLWLLYFCITLKERNEYMMSQSKGYKCIGSKDTSCILPGSETTYYFDRNLPPSRDYKTWKEFWKERY